MRTHRSLAATGLLVGLLVVGCSPDSDSTTTAPTSDTEVSATNVAGPDFLNRDYPIDCGGLTIGGMDLTFTNGESVIPEPVGVPAERLARVVETVTVAAGAHVVFIDCGTGEPGGELLDVYSTQVFLLAADGSMYDRSPMLTGGFVGATVNGDSVLFDFYGADQMLRSTILTYVVNGDGDGNLVAAEATMVAPAVTTAPATTVAPSTDAPTTTASGPDFLNRDYPIACGGFTDDQAVDLTFVNGETVVPRSISVAGGDMELARIESHVTVASGAHIVFIDCGTGEPGGPLDVYSTQVILLTADGTAVDHFSTFTTGFAGATVTGDDVLLDFHDQTDPEAVYSVLLGYIDNGDGTFDLAVTYD